MKRGVFITIEGIEGCGKSTHAAMLCARLRREGFQVHQTHEPGGTPMGETIRALLKKSSRTPISGEAELFLFAACRAQLVQTIILPKLKKGVIVVSDRFMDSTVAYQGYARGLNPKAIDAMNRIAVGAAVPDLTVLLDLDVPTGLARLRDRYRKNGASPDRIEQEDAAFHRMVRAGYLAIARKQARRVKIVDASGPVRSVAGAIWEIVRHAIV